MALRIRNAIDQIKGDVMALLPQCVHLESWWVQVAVFLFQ